LSPLVGVTRLLLHVVSSVLHVLIDSGEPGCCHVPPQALSTIVQSLQSSGMLTHHLALPHDFKLSENCGCENDTSIVAAIPDVDVSECSSSDDDSGVSECGDVAGSRKRKRDSSIRISSSEKASYMGICRLGGGVADVHATGSWLDSSVEATTAAQQQQCHRYRRIDIKVRRASFGALLVACFITSPPTLFKFTFRLIPCRWRQLRCCTLPVLITLIGK
jgi:hypothetical protein